MLEVLNSRVGMGGDDTAKSAGLSAPAPRMSLERLSRRRGSIGSDPRSSQDSLEDKANARSSRDSSDRRTQALAALAAAGGAAAGGSSAAGVDGLSAKMPNMSVGVSKWRQGAARVRRLSVTSIQNVSSALPSVGDAQASTPSDDPAAHGYVSTTDAARGSGASDGSARRSRRRSVETIDYNTADETLISKLEGSVAEARVSLRCAVVSRRGQEQHSWKRNNQDTYLMEADSLMAVAGAFDGHGSNGHNVSGFVRDWLRERLMELGGSHALEHDWESTITTLFVKCDQELKRSPVAQLDISGSTAVVAAVHRSTLQFAWVGDSRGLVVGRKGGKGPMFPMYVTKDHKPDDKKERQRILASNGRVDHLLDEDGEKVGPPRIFLKFAWTPGLATSRAFGDMLAHEVGVVARPEVASMQLTGDEEFMVLASDGVWEFMDEQAVIDVIQAEATPEAAANALVAEARKRWNAEEDVVDDVRGGLHRAAVCREGVACARLTRVPFPTRFSSHRQITAVLVYFNFTDDFRAWAATAAAGLKSSPPANIRVKAIKDGMGDLPSPMTPGLPQPQSPMWSELNK